MSSQNLINSVQYSRSLFQFLFNLPVSFYHFKSKFVKITKMNNTTLQKQIDDYLSQLSLSQKETVLSVVKTIADASHKYDNIDKEEVEIEMERRAKEYENGTAKLYKFEDIKKSIISKYEANNANKK